MVAVRLALFALHTLFWGYVLHLTMVHNHWSMFPVLIFLCLFLAVHIDGLVHTMITERNAKKNRSFLNRSYVTYYNGKGDQQKDITKIVRITLAVVSVLITSLVAMFIFSPDETNKMSIKLLPQEIKVLVIKENNSFSKSKLVKEMKKLRVRFPHIVYAQAVKESGFNSPIFRENNNMFGMKLAVSRPTTAIGESRNHAIYNNWRDCVIDYLLYQSCYLRHITTEDDYYKYLRSYAEDPNYVESIKKLSLKYKRLFKK